MHKHIPSFPEYKGVCCPLSPRGSYTTTTVGSVLPLFLSHALFTAFYSVGANNIGDDGVKSIAAAFESLNALEAL